MVTKADANLSAFWGIWNNVTSDETKQKYFVYHHYPTIPIFAKRESAGINIFSVIMPFKQFVIKGYSCLNYDTLYPPCIQTWGDYDSTIQKQCELLNALITSTPHWYSAFYGLTASLASSHSWNTDHFIYAHF